MPYIMANQWDNGQSGLSPVKKSVGEQLMQALAQGGGAYMKNKQDQSYRKAAADILGLPPEALNAFDREELKELVKEKYKSNINPGQWKPQNMEEAIAYKNAGRREKAPSATEQYRGDIQQAQKGEINWEDLINKYPDRAGSLQKTRSQVPDLRERSMEMNPEFEEGSGIRALLSPNVAKLNPETKWVIENKLKTPEDFQALIGEKQKGILPKKIDVKAIFEYFKPPQIPQDEWKKATDEQKADFLMKINSGR